MLGSVAFSIAEHVPLNRAFWWAITTASTVGFSDISGYTIVPKTLIGQFVVLVMIIIGVGMIGIVSSSLTTYFMRKNSVSVKNETQKDLKLIIQKLDKLERQSYVLTEQNLKMKEQIDQLKDEQNSSEWKKIKSWTGNHDKVNEAKDERK